MRHSPPPRRPRHSTLAVSLPHHRRPTRRPANSRKASRRPCVRASARGSSSTLGGIWEWRIGDGHLTWSDEVFRLFGLRPGEITPDYRTFLDFVHPLDRQRVEHAVELALESGRYRVEHRIIDGRGGERRVVERGQLVRDEAGNPLRMFGTVEPLPPLERHLDETLEQALFTNALEGVMITDGDARILAVNPAFLEITGYSERELLGESPRLLRSGRHDRAFYDRLWSELLHDGRWIGEIWNRRRDGSLIPLWQTITAIRDAHGEVTHYVALCSDISTLMATQERLERLAFHDPLTGLPNRLLFRDRLDHALLRARREGHQVALLFVDLDHFKRVNDTFGHPAGDQLLRQVAQRLSAALRNEDTVARVGGDEFVVILEGLGDDTDVAEVAEQIIERFGEPLILGDERLLVSLSIGISLYPDDADDASKLLERADRALYRTKAGGRNGYRLAN